MAVQPQTPYIEHIANGTTADFNLGFDCDNQDHLIVLVDDIEPVVGTWSLSNGAVVFGTAPTTGKKITIQRNTPFERKRDYQSYDNSFRPPAVNKDFDWIWLKLQELGVADWILGNRLDALKSYVNQQDGILQDNIDSLKNYVDDKDDELRNYLLNAIQEQGVALDQLEEYYSYLMQQLAQVAIDRGWAASFIVSADGSTQQEINDFGGAEWWDKPLGYKLGATVKLTNGDIVKSTVANNIVDPNIDSNGWEYLPDFTSELRTKVQNIEAYIDDYLTTSEKFFVINSDLAQTRTFNWSPVFERAIQDLKSKGGGLLRFKFRGQGYLINGITRGDGTKVGIMIPSSGFGQETLSHQTVSLVGESKSTKLYAGENDMEVVRYCASFGDVGNFSIIGSGKTKAKGLQLVPDNIVLARDLSQQSFNRVFNISMREVYEGLTLQCGGIGSAYYNHVSDVTVNYSGRAFHLKTGVPSTETPQSSNANRNVFVNCRGQIVRVGWHIEAGETNKFFGCGSEGSYADRGDQLDAPTALQIDNRDKNNRWTNHGNMFYGFTSEASTRDLYLYNPNTSFFGFTLDATKSYVTPNALTDGGLTMVGSADVTVFPNIQDGQMFLGNAVPDGISSLSTSYGLRNYSTLGVFDGNGARRTPIITAANSVGIAEVGDVHGSASKFSRNVNFTARFSMRPNATSDDIQIKLPFTPDVAIHTDVSGSEQRSLFNVIGYIAGQGYVNLIATITPTHLVINPPTLGWNVTDGERYNMIHISIQYVSEF